eukprot:1196158-Prorocentrum_minimum.AAC.2
MLQAETLQQQAATLAAEAEEKISMAAHLKNQHRGSSATVSSSVANSGTRIRHYHPPYMAYLEQH